MMVQIKYLSSLCPEEDLTENGVKVTGHVPKRLPILRYPQFTDSTTSLLKKHLTETVWRDLRGLKTKFEGRLANCILAGIENPTLQVGVYACDEEAYIHFKKLFEPIIKDIHDYDVKSGAIIKHHYDISGLEWGKLERTKHCIKFVQACASRNIEHFPFVPILDSLSKSEIEGKLAKVLVEEIDSKIPLNKMTPADKKKLADEGLLFDRHPSIESIMPNGKWSEGCSIYCNNDLSNVIWINADDHVQYFITNRTKPDLKLACEKLFGKLKNLESNIPLCHDPNIGYLTCNPSFLGTALRIKVIVQLQKASDSQIKFELLKNFCIQQGVEVRHAAQNTYEFTMSKTFQLGKTESDMIGGLVNSIAEILRVEETVMIMEEETIKKKVKEETEKVLKDMPIFDEINTSLIRPFINEDVWLKLGRIPTAFGHSLKECVKPGVANHKIGIIALDADCYHKYEDLFMNVIQIYHEDYKPINYPIAPTDPKDILEALKKFETVKYVIGGYAMWQGNMKECSFPGGLNKKQREESVMKLLVSLDAFNKQHMLTLSGVEDVEEVKNTLYYSDLVSEKNKVQEFSADWPDQRRLLKSPSSKLSLLVNIINHLAIAVPIDVKSLSSDVGQFFTAFDALVSKQAAIWAYSDKLGFYNSLPTEIGNGFNFKIAMKIPNLSNLGSYLPLAESKRVILSVVDTVMYLSHKHKFKTIAQSILDVMDVVSTISKMEEEKENKAKEAAAKLEPKPKPEDKKVEPPKAPEPMDIPKVEAKKEELKGAEVKKVEEKKNEGKEEKKPAGTEEKKTSVPTFPSEFKGAFKTILNEELIKACETLKAPNGLTLQHIIANSMSNPNDSIGLFVEGTQSLATFKNLYAATTKGISKGAYDLLNAKYNLTTDTLVPIDLPVIPSAAVGTIMEISRNVEGVPFPAFMQDHDREALLTKLAGILKELDVFIKK